MHDPQDLQELKARARQRGLRITRQRAIILQILCELCGHVSAERIYNRALQYQAGIDRSTVYRTLERLRDLRILSQTDLGRGCAEYELITGQPHHHLICQQCGQVIDLDRASLNPVAAVIRQHSGFEPIFDHLAIFGLCQACLSKDSSRCSDGYAA